LVFTTSASILNLDFFQSHWAAEPFANLRCTGVRGNVHCAVVPP